MALVFNPNLGMARDWDVFSFAGLPLVLLFTLLLIEQKQLAALGLCAMLALLVLLPRAGAQVAPQIAISHFRNYAKLNPLMNRTGVYAR